MTNPFDTVREALEKANMRLVAHDGIGAAMDEWLYWETCRRMNG